MNSFELYSYLPPGHAENSYLYHVLVSDEFLMLDEANHLILIVIYSACSECEGQ